MQRKIILTFLLCCWSLFSSADLKKNIENLNQSVKNAENPPAECPSCTVSVAGFEEDDATLMRKCVELICPNRDFSMAATLAKVYEKAAKPDALFDREIEPLIQAISKDNALEKVARSNSLLEWLNKAPSLKEPSSIKLFNLIQTLTHFSAFKIKENQFGAPIIDAENSRPQFLKLSDEEYDRRLKIGDKILRAFEDRAIRETDPARVQLLYGNKFHEKIAEAMLVLQDKKQQIANDPEIGFLTKDPGFKELFSFEKIEAQFSSDQINPESITNLNEINSVLTIFVASIKDPEFKKSLLGPEIDIKKTASDIGIETLLQDRLLKQKEFLKGTRPAFSLKCRVAFQLAQAGLPTQKELDQFSGPVKEIKSRFAQQTKGLVCPILEKNYRDQILTMTPNLPLTKEQFLKNMKNSLSRRLEESNKWKSKAKEAKNSERMDLRYSLGIASANSEYNETTKDIDSLCENLFPNLIPDMASPNGNSFVTGPLAIKFPEGSAISYHELGHKLYYYMSSHWTCDQTAFVKMRTCLNHNHTELSESTTKYESEDWADLISAQFDDQTRNAACVLMDKAKNEDFEKLSLTQTQNSNDHSSDLFRMLHVNFIKTGKIPAICQQALAAKNEKADFKNCLKNP